MISVHIIVDGAAAAADWYERVYGARLLSRLELADGRQLDVRLDVGGSELVLADEFPEQGVRSPASTGESSAVLYLHCNDVDATWARAIAEGATVLRDLNDAFWGEREGQLVDPWGHRWGLTQHLHDVSIEEQAAIASQVFGITPAP